MLSIYVLVCVITGKENLIQTLIDLFSQPFSYGNHENSHPLLHVYDARNSLYSIHYYQKKLFFEDLFVFLTSGISISLNLIMNEIY